MSNLFDFLIDLAVDINKQDMLAADAEALIEAAGLSGAGKASLQRRDRASLTAALAEDLPISEFAAVVGSCYVGDPGPDPTPDPDPPEPSSGD